jgi:hypothetical protein
MEEQKILERLDKLINLLEPIVTAQGLRISGQGMIANNTEKQLEKLDKIQKFLFFMEKRQAEMFDFEKAKI